MNTLERFAVQDAAEIYGVPYWGTGYFRANKTGKIETTPQHATGPGIVLQDVVDELVRRGESLPVILRFPQILRSRLKQLNAAFRHAVEEYQYPGRYQGVFPIKVNQRRVVVETIAAAGWDYAHGLEAGSKAELALCLAQDLHPEALLCCNGFKDDGFVRLALWGRKLGKNVVITLEKFGELERVLRLSRELNVKPAIGVRFKLHARGSGQWEESGGDQAKFGLNASELLAVVRRLQAKGLEDSLVMLHCHVGSQLTDIRKIKVAVREAAQTYAELRELDVPVKYLNVGGGLAVDYDGSKTTFYASANYTLQEYANEIIYNVLETCKAAEVEEYPVVVSESGRAITAHHAVLVLPVIDVVGPTRFQEDLGPGGPEQHALITDLEATLESVNVKNYREAYYDAVANKDTMHNLFDLGYLTLEDRARGEALFNRIAEKVSRVVADLKYIPDEFEDLPALLADKYICNFSLFQSLPDSWAINALFPITPLSRLDERPTRRATIVDISCDSDGKIEKFVDLRDVKNTLPLHELRSDEPYYLGVFLMGAYQDVLGSAHNLFGKVNEAHVTQNATGGFDIELFVRGQKARRLIEGMGYEAPDLSTGIEIDVKEAIEAGRVSTSEAEQFMGLYNEELVGYTYLEYEREEEARE
ncbi:MAG TPA: biosynthetic arginine decarboxylase [Deinococcales bacterium]|nr:biosynthetic arginine decarboxylase [Deinococcales bacterium]